MFSTIFSSACLKSTAALFFPKVRRSFYMPIFFLVVFLNTSCTTHNLGTLTPPLAEKAPLYINSRTLTFTSQIPSPTTNEDLNFLLNQYESWAHNHFLARGHSGTSVLSLESLSIEDRQDSKQAETLFGGSPSQQLTATIRLKLVIRSENTKAHKERFFEGTAAASHTYSRAITLLEREKILASLANQLITRLSNQFASLDLSS